MRPRHGLRFGALLLAVAAVFAGTTSAQASYVVNFKRITNNNNPDIYSQMQLVVEDRTDTSATNDVKFTFRNVGSVKSVITKIYFDDGSLMGATFDYSGSGSGVDFNHGSWNDNDQLPGGTPYNFSTSGLLVSDADDPSPKKGINNAAANSATEVLVFNFDLQGTQTYADVIASLELAKTNPFVDLVGGLRVGMHVQSIGDNSESDTYMSGLDNYDPLDPTNPVPAPPALILAVIGVGLFGAVGRRMRRSQAAV